MSALATEIIGSLALLGGLLVLWICAAVGMVFNHYGKKPGLSIAWALAFILIFAAIAALIITKVGRFLDWLVS